MKCPHCYCYIDDVAVTNEPSLVMVLGFVLVVVLACRGMVDVVQWVMQ